MAARLLFRRVLVGNSEYGLPVESMGTLGGTQIQEGPDTNWLQMPGHFARHREKIGGRNPVLESSSHSGGARKSLV